MSQVKELVPTGSHRRSAPGATVDALASAISAEAQLLERLTEIMRQQRECVAKDDLQGVDDTVFATHRILVTLGEARRQRRALGKLVADTDDAGVGTLEDALGDRMTDGLRAARDNLLAAAAALSRDVETNRRLLRASLSAGGEMVRGLLATAGPAPTYGDSARPPAEPAGGTLIDRQA